MHYVNTAQTVTRRETALDGQEPKIIQNNSFEDFPGTGSASHVRQTHQHVTQMKLDVIFVSGAISNLIKQQSRNMCTRTQPSTLYGG